MRKKFKCRPTRTRKSIKCFFIIGINLNFPPSSLLLVFGMQKFSPVSLQLWRERVREREIDGGLQFGWGLSETSSVVWRKWVKVNEEKSEVENPTQSLNPCQCRRKQNQTRRSFTPRRWAELLLPFFSLNSEILYVWLSRLAAADDPPLFQLQLLSLSTVGK